MSKGKLFSDFSSFGPSLAESTHEQSVDGNQEDIFSSGSDTPIDSDTNAKHRLRVPPPWT